VRLASGAEREITIEVRGGVFVEECPGIAAAGEGGDAGVEEGAGEAVDGAGIEGEGVAERDGGGGGGGEDDDGAVGEGEGGVIEGGADALLEGGPGLSGVFDLAADPGHEDGAVDVVLIGFGGGEARVGLGKGGEDFVVEMEEVELIPARVNVELGRGGELAERVVGGELLAAEGAGEGVLELDGASGEVGAEEAGLGVAEGRELIVVMAGAGLAMAYEIESAHGTYRMTDAVDVRRSATIFPRKNSHGIEEAVVLPGE